MPVVVSIKKETGETLWKCCMNTQGKAPRCGACVRCHAFKYPSREQCKNRSCMGNYCHIHLRKKFYEQRNDEETTEIGLRIKKSTIKGAGLGLFAARDFGYNQNIMKLDYDTISDEELKKRYDYTDKDGKAVIGLAPYAFAINSAKGIIGDAACTRNAPSFANDKTKSRGSGYKGANAIFKPYNWPAGSDNWEVWLKSKRSKIQSQNKPGSKAVAIKAGQEIFIAYGRQYWDVAHTSNIAHKRAKISKAKDASKGDKGRIIRPKPAKK